METLVKLDRFGDAAIHLTNKLSNAIGWVANMETPRKVAINTYIKEIQENNILVRTVYLKKQVAY